MFEDVAHPLGAVVEGVEEGLDPLAEVGVVGASLIEMDGARVGVEFDDLVEETLDLLSAFRCERRFHG